MLHVFKRAVSSLRMIRSPGIIECATVLQMSLLICLDCKVWFGHLFRESLHPAFNHRPLLVSLSVCDVD